MTGICHRGEGTGTGAVVIWLFQKPWMVGTTVQVPGPPVGKAWTYQSKKEGKRPRAMGPGGPANGLRRHRRGNQIGGDLTWREVWWETILLLSLVLMEGLGTEREREMGCWVGVW